MGRWTMGKMREIREVEWTARAPLRTKTANDLLLAGVALGLVGFTALASESRAVLSSGGFALVAGWTVLRRRSPDARAYRLNPLGTSAGEGFLGPHEIEWKDLARIEIAPDEIRLLPIHGRKALTLRLPEAPALRARVELSVLGLTARRSPAEVVYDDPHGAGG